ncbi:hypothetical protein M378DRAFT_9415 [Amanita muscaria Koide BX008]|uniref:Uncharacterized protein n=1 Tax=Amanita muscaria (strain Koide BX008) TaxID=946122 RepID=A0A0C2XFL8_AMAMK|nr:hypothetical protein M378DRAFT_9415 [Amanita muscaria Koide BX008]
MYYVRIQLNLHLLPVLTELHRSSASSLFTNFRTQDRFTSLIFSTPPFPDYIVRSHPLDFPRFSASNTCDPSHIFLPFVAVIHATLFGYIRFFVKDI